MTDESQRQYDEYGEMTRSTLITLEGVAYMVIDDPVERHILLAAKEIIERESLANTNEDEDNDDLKT